MWHCLQILSSPFLFFFTICSLFTSSACAGSICFIASDLCLLHKNFAFFLMCCRYRFFFFFKPFSLLAVLCGIILIGNLDFYLWKSISFRFGRNFLLKGLGIRVTTLHFPFSRILNLTLTRDQGRILWGMKTVRIVLSNKTILPVLMTFRHFLSCRCGSRTEEQNGGKGSVLVRCSRSEHISPPRTSCHFWHVPRTTHRYRRKFGQRTKYLVE